MENTLDLPRSIGTVRKFIEAKGIGFLEDEQNKTHSFVENDILPNILYAREKVRFTSIQTKNEKGFCYAKMIEAVDAEAPDVVEQDEAA